MPPLKPVLEKKKSRLGLMTLTRHGGRVVQAKFGPVARNGGRSYQLGSLLQMSVMNRETLGRKYIPTLCIGQIIHEYRKWP